MSDGPQMHKKFRATDFERTAVRYRGETGGKQIRRPG